LPESLLKVSFFCTANCSSGRTKLVQQQVLILAQVVLQEEYMPDVGTFPITVRRGKKQVEIEVTPGMSIAELKAKLHSTDVWLGNTNDKRKINGSKKMSLIHHGEKLIYDQYYVSDYNIEEGDTLVVPGAADLPIAPMCRQVSSAGKSIRRHSFASLNSLTMTAKQLSAALANMLAANVKPS
jgi:hypothetical protein